MAQQQPGLTPQKKAEIGAALARAGATACPQCGNGPMIVHDYYTIAVRTTFIDGQMNTDAGTGTVSAVTYCSQCGFVALHALGVLGITP